MRKLTSKQKKILDKNPDWDNAHDVPSETWKVLEGINDTEILWQEVNRYLMDREFADRGQT